MKLAGSPSWTFRHGIAQLPHAAVYVRDAAGLQPPPDAVLPPRLGVPEHQRRDVLDQRRRAEAGAHWLRWWRGLVTAEATDRGNGGEIIQHSFWPGDDGTIAGLGPGNQSALRQAVAAAFADGCRWRPPYRKPSGRALSGIWSATSPRTWHDAIRSAPAPCAAPPWC